MASPKYRLKTVTVEGFGGFTDPQAVRFGGKHIFLFGPNGQGKSSILEAIRWCLFGLANRPETEVRNTFYALRECSATLELLGSSNTLSVRRKLRPGALRSDQTITDPLGNEVQQAEVFPQLARLGPKEGTHIIIAGQQAAARRPQPDISDFSKVLYSYLKLEDVPDFLDELTKLIEEKAAERDKLAGNLEDLKATARAELAKVELKLEELLKSPPWEGTSPPTLSDTERKIEGSYVEMQRLLGETKQDTILASEMIEKIESASKSLASVEHSKIEPMLKAQKLRLNSIKVRRAVLQGAIAMALGEQNNLEQRKGELVDILQGETITHLQEGIASLEQEMTVQQVRSQMLQLARALLENNSLEACPLCGVHHGSELLKSKIEGTVSSSGPEATELSKRLQDQRDRLKKAVDQEEAVGKATDNLNVYEKRKLDATHALTRVLETLALPTDQEIDSGINALEDAIRHLEDQLKGLAQANTDRDKANRNLETELRFHDYQKEATRLRKLLSEGIGRPQAVFDEYQSLLRTTQEVKDVLSEAFDGAIGNAIPTLDQMMTEVYRRLTQQASFDKVFVTKDGEKLSLQVGSTKCSGSFNPEDVLNGQANSALRLVPYFVFSEFQTEALELELLLIDDPSQSFDTSHVESLLEELKKVASRAQLIVASHEEEKFGPVLNKYFSKDEYAVITVNEFDPIKGPTVAYR